jgi:HlyD family secretion protein
MKRTIVLSIVLVAVVALVLLGVWYRREQSVAGASEYETVAVWRDTILATVNASGTVKPAVQVDLTFPTGGLLAVIHVEPGQRVEAGEGLARLDARQLELAVTQAEATLRINEVRLAQTQAGADASDITAAEAAMQSAQASFDRLRAGPEEYDVHSAKLNVEAARDQLWSAQAQRDSVRGNPLSTQAAIDSAEAQVLIAEGNVQLALIAQERLSEPPNPADVTLAWSQLVQAEAQLSKLQRAPSEEDLAIAEAQVAQAQASLEQAVLRRDDALLVAPFAGTVLATGAEAGEVVSAATPVVVLADLESHYVEASIDESDIGRVEVGQDVLITLDAFPDIEQKGRISRVEPLGQVTQGVVSYAVRVTVTPSEAPLRPNMTALVDIVVDRKQGVLVVPNRAIKRESGGRRYVEMLEGSELVQRFVTTGLSNELVTEIREGVVEGEEVVVSAPRENILEQFGTFRFGGGH